ncbi:hypothetical protein [Saccharopolyspora phatthalungensis]|uniref:Uncharacterized protein n=1 Tax=Saccharopolyspora phatthalungensis TaxID=664693 RepID=A0A840QF70_9PSEU|nr:hypothetical protein [Saccharopolyspora phatthalungensis]MBB5158707.1 hypothetical protein [Saccharopolyspora phatthalungensis]
MSSEANNVPKGYPGFRVRDPAPLRPTPATLKRVALAKLSSVEFFSASFGGESFVFAPWLTTLIDYGTAMRFAGVYRTEPVSAEDDEEAPSADARRLCIRRSEWIRDVDLAQASEADDLGDYLAAGPQIANTFVFTTTHAQQQIADITSRMLDQLARGITISASEPRPAAWQEVAVEVADDRFITNVNYSPLLTRCDILESSLPPWLEATEAAVKQEGILPDGDVTLSIRRSVPELVHATFRPTHG